MRRWSEAWNRNTCSDILLQQIGAEWFHADRVVTSNTHGTGCTLSSAVATYLANGLSLNESVRIAKDYISKAIAAADNLKIGSGCGPVHHFHGIWK